MKHVKLLSILFLLAILGFIFYGCPGDIPGEGDNDDFFTADVGYQGFQSDAEIFYEFVYYKEATILEFLNYSSDGFTTGPFEGTISNDEFAKLFGYLATISENSERYEAVIKRMEESGVLERPTQTRGLISSTANFFKTVSGLNKKNHNRYYTVYTNVPPAARTVMYNYALECWDRNNWESRPVSEAEFLTNLQKGIYEKHGCSLMKDVHLLAADNIDIGVVLQEKNLLPQDIIPPAMGEVAVAGSQVYLDMASTLVAGSDKGMEIVTITDNVDRLARSKTFQEKAKAKEDVMGQVKSKIQGKLIGDNFSDLLDEGVEALAHMVEEKAKKARQAKNNEKAAGKEGTVQIKDGNDKTPANIIISQKKEKPTTAGEPSILVTAKKEVVKGINQVLGVGKWLITAISKNGNRETVEIQVEPEQTTIMQINTDPPSITWEQLVAAYPHMKGIPKFNVRINEVDTSRVEGYGFEVTKWLDIEYQHITPQERDNYLKRLKSSGFPMEQDESLYYCVKKDRPNKGEKLVVGIAYYDNDMTISIGVTTVIYPDNIEFRVTIPRKNNSTTDFSFAFYSKNENEGANFNIKDNVCTYSSKVKKGNKLYESSADFYINLEEKEITNGKFSFEVTESYVDGPYNFKGEKKCSFKVVNLPITIKKTKRGQVYEIAFSDDAEIPQGSIADVRASYIEKGWEYGETYITDYELLSKVSKLRVKLYTSNELRH
jgi:hypothetical protein